MKAKKTEKPRASKPRKKKAELERWPPMLASEAGLRCMQYKQTRPGRFEKCSNAATGYLPGIGDSCDDHKRKPLIRYATERRAIERLQAA